MAAASAVAPSLETHRSPWIGSAGWDLFWMFSALWAAALLLVSGSFRPIADVALALFTGNVVLSLVHTWSTSYMVLASPLFASVRAADRLRYRVLPAVIVLGALALGTLMGLLAGEEQPWKHWTFGLYIALFWVGHFWHFGKQDFGVLSLYRIRAGQNRAIDRRTDRLYTALMMFIVQPVAVVYTFAQTAVAEVFYANLPIRANWLETAATAIVPVSTLAFVAVVAFELSKPGRSLPKLLYYAVIFVHPVFVYLVVSNGNPAFLPLYVVTYLWSHWFIAIGLVSRVNAGHLESEGRTRSHAWLRHGATLFAIALGFFLIEMSFYRFELFRTTEYRSVLLDIGQRSDAALIGFMLGFLLAGQLLHYYCDRCMFRFRDPAVREKVAPHLLRTEA